MSLSSYIHRGNEPGNALSLYIMNFIYLDTQRNPHEEVIRTHIISRRNVYSWKATVYLTKDIENHPNTETQLVVLCNGTYYKCIASICVSNNYRPYNKKTKRYLEKLSQGTHYCYTTTMQPLKSRLSRNVFSFAIATLPMTRSFFTSWNKAATITDIFFPFECYRSARIETENMYESYHNFLSFVINFPNALLWWNIMDKKKQTFSFYVRQPKFPRRHPFGNKKDNTWYAYYYYCGNPIGDIPWLENLSWIFGDKNVTPQTPLSDLCKELCYVCNLYQVGKTEAEKALQNISQL